MTPDELRERLARFAEEVARFAQPLWDSPRTREIAEQLTDSSTSSAANHRAAGRGRSHGEFTSKLGIALEEIDESQYWLQHLRRANLAPEVLLQPLLNEATELVKILTSSYKTAKANEELRKRRTRRR